MVPKDMQDAVNRFYQAGQCKTMNISREWLRAAVAARNHVEALERQAPREEE
jgi:hypothetical protein